MQTWGPRVHQLLPGPPDALTFQLPDASSGALADLGSLASLPLEKQVAGLCGSVRSSELLSHPGADTASKTTGGV